MLKRRAVRSYGDKYSSVNSNSLQRVCSNDRLSKQIKPKRLYITHPGRLSGQILSPLHSCLINCLCRVYVLMWGRERGRTDMSPRAWAETNKARQPQGEAVKLVFLYFHVSAVVCCHIRKLCSVFRCALLVNLLMVGVCVLNLSLSALWSPCPNRFGWSLLVGCVQYLCRAGYMCTWVFVCRADAPKA